MYKIYVIKFNNKILSVLITYDSLFFFLFLQKLAQSDHFGHQSKDLNFDGIFFLFIRNSIENSEVARFIIKQISKIPITTLILDFKGEIPDSIKKENLQKKRFRKVSKTKTYLFHELFSYLPLLEGEEKEKEEEVNE